MPENEINHAVFYAAIMDGIIFSDLNGMIINANQVFQDMLGYSLDELSNFNYLDLPPPPPHTHTQDKKRHDLEKTVLLGQILQRGYSDTYEKEFYSKNGFPIPVELRSVLLKDSADQPSGMCVIVRDITERKIYEKKLKNMIAEKELVLKEVHHRLKNNMKTIHSLLVLQAAALSDPVAVTALEDASSRVNSMIILYNQLFQSIDVTKVSVHDYLPALIDEIISNFHNCGSVRIEKKIDDFFLKAKQLQPLGILLNEILTNSMKHAFTGRKSGVISVSAEARGNRIVISIGDNGKGLPETLDFEKSTGFGLVLVRVLAKQLSGTIRIERENGTRYILEFNK